MNSDNDLYYALGGPTGYGYAYQKKYSWGSYADRKDTACDPKDTQCMKISKATDSRNEILWWVGGSCAFVLLFVVLCVIEKCNKARARRTAAAAERTNPGTTPVNQVNIEVVMENMQDNVNLE